MIANPPGMSTGRRSGRRPRGGLSTAAGRHQAVRRLLQAVRVIPPSRQAVLLEGSPRAPWPCRSAHRLLPADPRGRRGRWSASRGWAASSASRRRACRCGRWEKRSCSRRSPCRGTPARWGSKLLPITNSVGAAADVHHTSCCWRGWQRWGDAHVDQAGLLAAGDDLDRKAQRGLGLHQEVGAFLATRRVLVATARTAWADNRGCAR